MAMSRQRIGAPNTSRPRQTIRPSYEDFQPQFELKDEDEAHIIYVQLPGFLKEQVRITFVHAPGVIRVHGQRPLGNNSWSRFNQTFPLPQNCHESKIQGKFNNGVLTITLPKEVIPKTDPVKETATAAKAIQETDPKTAAAEAKPQKVLEEKEVPSKEKDQIRSPPSQKPVVEPKVQKGQDTIHQPAIATAAKDHQIAAPVLEAQKGLPLTKTKDHKDTEEGAAPHAVSAMTQNEKQREEKRVIALSSAETQPKPQKPEDEIPPKTMADETAKAYYLDKGTNNEEKQLLINVGAAVLVLVAFGAYTTYSLWCPGRPKN